MIVKHGVIYDLWCNYRLAVQVRRTAYLFGKVTSVPMMGSYRATRLEICTPLHWLLFRWGGYVR